MASQPPQFSGPPRPMPPMPLPFSGPPPFPMGLPPPQGKLMLLLPFVPSSVLQSVPAATVNVCCRVSLPTGHASAAAIPCRASGTFSRHDPSNVETTSAGSCPSHVAKTHRQARLVFPVEFDLHSCILFARYTGQGRSSGAPWASDCCLECLEPWASDL